MQDNPLLAGLGLPREPQPLTLVIFGASGDLTRRKLIPALFSLYVKGAITGVRIVGFARRDWDTAGFRALVRKMLDSEDTAGADAELKDSFAEGVGFIRSSFESAEGYAEIEKAYPTPSNRIFYLAAPPDAYEVIVERIGAAGLADQSRGFSRIIVEKPLGHDLASARALNERISHTFPEDQIYRIDHYLGKETVQNIMAFRFANGIFEPIWNRRYIDHIQISVAETVGVEQRGGYYDQAGALRDMVPNHVMQLISLTAMEPPISFQADAVRDEQAKILHAIQPLSSEDVLSRTVRGQYGEGEAGGQHLAAYRSETGVPADSRCETYVAMKVQIDNWRWAGVPFYVRTGKRMPARNTHIVIQFRQAPFVLFRDTTVDALMPNQLVLHIQPEEGISLRFAAKTPGPVMRLGTVDMDFEYADYFGKQPSTGYERLLHDCMVGDATLFQRADMVEAGWSVVSPMLDVWKALPPRSFPNYAAGTWGPKEADALLGHDGRQWRNFEK